MPGFFERFPIFQRPASLRLVIAVVVAIPVTVLFAVLLVYSYYSNRYEAAVNMRSQMFNEVSTRSKTLNNHLLMKSRIPDEVALSITIRTPKDVDEMLSYQFAMLAENPTIYGNCIAWEPYAFDPEEKYCGPYTWRDMENGGAVTSMMFTPENDYDYFGGWEWYDAPKAKYAGDDTFNPPIKFLDESKDAPILPKFVPGLWSKPYFDEGGGDVLMCTYSAPFFKGKRFAGVVTCDIPTDWIREFLDEKSPDGTFFVLMSNDGTIISHPIAEHINRNMTDIIPADKRPAWSGLLSGVKRYEENGQRTLHDSHAPDAEWYYIPEMSQELPGVSYSGSVWTEAVRLPSTDWILLCVTPRESAYKAANAQFKTSLVLFLFGLLGLCGYLLWLVDRQLITPIRRLLAATNAIAAGEFDHRITAHFKSGRELIELARNFNTMSAELEQSVAAVVQSASAREMALAANRAKSEFLMLISHELRTPLSGVIGATELLMETGLSPKQTEYAMLQKEAGLALLLLINNILDYSKLDLGGITFQENDFDIREFMDSLYLISKYHAKSRNLVVECEIDKGLSPYMHGDDGRLRQVMMNLLNNAIKFSKDSKVLIRIFRDGDDPPEKQRIKFEVIDNGIGIVPELQSKLFSTTWRCEDSSSSHRLFDGIGLGLTITKHIVDSMGGTVGLESTVGKGSNFWFIVPLPVVEREEPDDSSREPREEDLPQPENSYKILVAEDNRINQIVIKEILAGAFYDCDVVENGKIALEAFQEGMYDLVVMDCQMPILDGYEATEAIRKIEKEQKKKPIPIVALTANAAPGDRERCLDVGMNSYCNKPINSKELIRIIDTLLDNPVVR